MNKNRKKIKESPVVLMVQSGARGDMKQIVQLGGMRGQVDDIDKNPLEPPVTRNYKKGISPLEYYLGSHTARRSMCEKKLLTAPAGDFTRRLIEAAYRIIVKCDDCKPDMNSNIKIYPFPKIQTKEFEKLPSLEKRLVGRYEVEKNTFINEQRAHELSKKNKPVTVRSPLTCQADKKYGPGAVCQKCYGWDLSKRELPEIGLPVGILAGESIGERGTQLAMRTFHTGGVGGGSSIKGLPRIKKIFSNHFMQLKVYTFCNSGKLNLNNDQSFIDQWSLLLKSSELDADKINQIKVKLKKNREYCEGKISLNNIYQKHGLQGISTVISYEARRLYKKAVDEKHFEVILKSMIFRDKKNKSCLIGINKASLQQPSFLAAASFQRSINILASAALENSEDCLKGYKERFITGKKMIEDGSDG